MLEYFETSSNHSPANPFTLFVSIIVVIIIIVIAKISDVKYYKGTSEIPNNDTIGTKSNVQNTKIFTH